MPLVDVSWYVYIYIYILPFSTVNPPDSQTPSPPYPLHQQSSSAAPPPYHSLPTSQPTVATGASSPRELNFANKVTVFDAEPDVSRDREEEEGDEDDMVWFALFLIAEKKNANIFTGCQNLFRRAR